MFNSSMSLNSNSFYGNKNVTTNVYQVDELDGCSFEKSPEKVLTKVRVQKLSVLFCKTFQYSRHDPDFIFRVN